jgi:single-strand DNA-binding protein
MLNKIFIMGRLTYTPELRRTQNGTAVTSFTLAVDRDFKDKDGEKVADFIDCVAWRTTAEFVAKNFAKGRMAVVEGRLQLRDFKDKDGNSRKVSEVHVDNIYFGDSKPQNNGSYSNYAAQVAMNNSAEAFEEIEDDGEDLPF